jgi:protein SCO1/2
MRVLRIVLASAALAVVGWSLVHSARSTSEASAPAWRGRFPNVPLRTHDGRTVRFYDDLLRGKIVTLNFMYVECEGTCPGLTSTLVELQKQLGDRVGRDILMLSITLQPEADTSERLRAYADRYGAGPGMIFLTGKPGDIDVLRRALGFTDERNPGRTAIGESTWGSSGSATNPRGWVGRAVPPSATAGQIRALLSSMDAPAVAPRPPLENPDGPSRGRGPERPGSEGLRSAADRPWTAPHGARRTGVVLLRESGADPDGAVPRLEDASAGGVADGDERSAGRQPGRATPDGGGPGAARAMFREAWARYQEEQSKALRGLGSVPRRLAPPQRLPRPRPPAGSSTSKATPTTATSRSRGDKMYRLFCHLWADLRVAAGSGMITGS